MAKARKNGGEKAHRKKIQKRNKLIKSQRHAMQKLFDETLKKQLESLQKESDSISGITTSNEQSIL